MGYWCRELVFRLITLVIFACLGLRAGGNIVNGGNYRIRSMFDGLFLTAGAGTGDSLGELTAEKWGNFREQRWDAIGLDEIGKEYWLSSHENTFNKMSAAIVQDKMDRHINELIPVKRDIYLLRSSLSRHCIENPGYGLRILSLPCDDLSVKQHWELDRLSPS